jgi:hypothetical protein
VTTIPGPGTDDHPVVWRLWWRFGFMPITRLIGLIPVAEWRRETWVWRLDVWAMRHIGTIRLHR